MSEWQDGHDFLGCPKCRDAWMEFLAGGGSVRPPLDFCSECLKVPAVAEVVRSAKEISSLLQAHDDRITLEAVQRAAYSGRRPLFGEDHED